MRVLFSIHFMSFLNCSFGRDTWRQVALRDLAITLITRDTAREA
jgi:hypothetical protein